MYASYILFALPCLPVHFHSASANIVIKTCSATPMYYSCTHKKATHKLCYQTSK